jgi:hypothetical protein
VKIKLIDKRITRESTTRWIVMAIFIVNAGFKALLGGGRDFDGRYSRPNAHGFFGQLLKMIVVLPSFAISRTGHRLFINNRRAEKRAHFLFVA